MKFFLLSILILFLCFTETTAFAKKNITLDRSIDQMLLRIESAVKKQNLSEFESYFAPKFDSECAWKFIEKNGQTWKRSWFDRYYSELTTSQLDTFVLRRFGHVDARGKDFKFKFSESHNVTENLLLRSFVAETKRTPTNSFAIQTIRYYGEY